MSIQCQVCLSENADNANFCNQCGARLRSPRKEDFRRHILGRRRYLLLPALLACLFLGIGLFLYTIDQSGINVEQPLSSSEEMPAKGEEKAQLPAFPPVARNEEGEAAEPVGQIEKQEAAVPAAPVDQIERQEAAEPAAPNRLPDSGYVTVIDSWGLVTAEVPAVVVDAGWIAVPTMRPPDGRQVSSAGCGNRATMWVSGNWKTTRPSKGHCWPPGIRKKS